MSQEPHQEIIPPSRSVKAPSEADQQNQRDTGQTRILNVGHVHWYSNDIAELAKLAAVDSALAHKVVDQRDNEDKRANNSYRFGMVVSVALVALIIFAFTFLFVKVGVWSTLLAIAFVIATALLIRVIVTGQWSETTWFGKIVDALSRALGSVAGPE